MKENVSKTIRDTYAAAAFAEAGEHETAMRMAGISAKAATVFDSVVKWFDSHMKAVCYAEAGCFDHAAEMLGAEKRAGGRNGHDTLNDFLENVGLGQVNVRYGWATVDI